MLCGIVKLGYKLDLLFFINNFLASSSLRQLLVSLEHLLEHEQKREDFILAGAGDQDLRLILQDCLLNFGLESIVAYELIIFA